ncbi:MAG: DNA recombination protein RmuC [Elusimicrobiota bacterium]
MPLILFAGIVIIIVLLVLQFLNSRPVDYASKFEASLNEHFRNFQTDIHRELNSTREEVNRSKDLISEHAVKTIDTIKEMGSTLHKIIQQQEEAQKLGQSLKDVLQVPKLRGSYGEAVLEEMLERVLPDKIWEKQYTITDGKKVDAVVKLKDIVIPIDAKFPRDDYNRYLESDQPDEKKQHWKNHEKAVKNQIKSISDKYIKPENGTSDFALMFIPSEAVYYETIAEKNYIGEPSDMYDYAQSNRVIPVSPNTFYAFLQVVVMGTRNMEIMKSAKKLQEDLSALERSFGLFYNKYEDMGKHIDKAAEAYRIGEGHISKYKKRLDTVLRMDELTSSVLPEDTSVSD